MRGSEREAAIALGVPGGALPVLLGSGLGVCLAALLERGPVAVVDRETAILERTGALARAASHPNLHLLEGDPDSILEQVDKLRKRHGKTTVHPVRVPLYLRLNPVFYRKLDEGLVAMVEYQRGMRMPRFERVQPRVLIIAKPYFLYREIEAALDQLGNEHLLVELPESELLQGDFVERLLLAVAEFKPDFALTVNHFGLDREGRLVGLLEEIGLPLASWFVDSPQLILNDYPRLNTPGTCVFSYDAASLEWLRSAGFSQVHYLPLATDPARFKPGAEVPAAWHSRVSFVGDSMTSQVRAMREEARAAPAFHAALSELAYAFALSDEVLPLAFLERCHPDIHAEVVYLAQVESRLACEKALTFTAARQYRLRCVKGIMPFSPLIAGDDGWGEALGEHGWQPAGRLDYYRDLPGFYAATEVSFNCTSVQMKGAVNQRVFDVPASGGFLVTDWREQMADLFDLDTEAACYRSPEEVADVVAAWLADQTGRERMACAARRRILAEHTYAHRLRELVEIMRRTYA